MADENTNISRTEKFQLPYLATAGKLTPSIESQRYITLDVQLEAIFNVLGNGVISGWELSKTAEPTNGVEGAAANNTLYIKLGKGHINYIAAETTEWYTMSNLPSGKMSYIYATTEEDTPLTKVPVFFFSTIPLTQDNIIALGTAEFDSTGVCTTIADGERKDIGFFNVLFNTILAHKHGQDGVPAVDLANDVKGILSPDSIADIPAERITSGIISPERFSMSHEDLLNAGTISHEDIDSLIEKLQKSNQRLFGDISASNLLTMIIELKKVYPNCDRYFRNLFVMVPGLDNNTFDNDSSFLEPTSAHDTNIVGNSYVNHDGQTIYFNTDAAVVNYNESYVTGAVSVGRTMHASSIDTTVEFRRGRYFSDYIEITGFEGDFDYGYGYGYGEGADYFDIFGISSGITDVYGTSYQYGYGTPDFETLFANNYGYGYGYEYIYNTTALEVSGHVSVRLKRGPVANTLFSKGSLPYYFNKPLASEYMADSTGVDDESLYWGTAPSGVTIYGPNVLTERLTYTPATGTDGAKFDQKIENPKLSVQFETAKDWTVYTNIFLTLKGALDEIAVEYYVQYPFGSSDFNDHGYYEEVLTDMQTVLEQYQWLLKITDSTGAYATTPIFAYDSAKVEQVNIGGLGHYRINVTANGDPLAFALDSFVGIAGVDITDIKKISIVCPSGYAPAINSVVEPCSWDEYIYSIGIGGVDAYMDDIVSDPSPNAIDQLYMVIPANEPAKLETISWLADEPSDSRVLVYIKSVDASDPESGDGFTLLEAASFGNFYSNKHRAGDSGGSASPSGSVVREPAGTHVELKVALQPSVDQAFTPTLHSVTLRYSTEGGEQEIIYDTEAEFYNCNKISNIDITDSNLKLEYFDEVKARRLGQLGKIQELVWSGNTYVDANRPDNTGSHLPLTLDEYLGGNTESSYGRVSAIKRMSDGNLAIADTLKDRVVIIDGRTHSFIKGFYGPKAYANKNSIAEKLKLAFVHYNSSTYTIFAGFSHKLSAVSTSQWSVWNIGGSEGGIKNFYIKPGTASTQDTVDILDCNGLDGNGGGGMVRIKLGDTNQARMDELIAQGGTLKLVLPTSFPLTAITVDAATNIDITTASVGDVDTGSFSQNIEVLEIYYESITRPIDLKCDSSDNLLLAQAIDSAYSMTEAPSILKFNPDTPPSTGTTAQIKFTGSDFSFDKEFLGSVEEIVTSDGESLILVADCNNKRVVLYDPAPDPSIPSTSYPEIYSSASLYPTCATLGSDNLYYITVADKTSSIGGSVVVTSGLSSSATSILEGDLSSPKDVYYIVDITDDSTRLLISS